MWLWTLRTGDGGESASPDDDDANDDTDAPAERGVTGTYVLEYDAARKIAQGLGAHLEKMADFVEVKGDRARMLSAGERAPRLFGKADAAVKRPAKARKAQIGLFDSPIDLEETTNAGVGGVEGAQPGVTVLDRVHQGMILFGAGRGEALKRFLLDDGAGQDALFWRLAQAGECVLVLQRGRGGSPIHVVWGLPKGQSSPAVLVTAYRPDPARWTDDFMRRKR